ncbi:hypothetical protein DL96DRAFT_1816591 [Flagelloscypha sp. PMI_526]|nr:hypothetical protein DL96DRAFT_1816591 [Flagelloscypha sp. PMI_526]
MPAPSHGIRVISFDGPALDATGLSELLILEDIAGKWAWDREDDDREGADIPIGELCDIVGGTGIGGFYAILFSLNLTVGQVITSHKILQNVLFSSNEWERKDSTGCVDALKTALTQVVEEVGLEVDLDSPFLSKNSLKCFVCVLNDITAGRSRALRNYRVRSSKSPRCSIREAIQATLADGVHLPPVHTQDEQFICASSGFANPSYELMKELPAAFPKGSKLACFVNLGSGGLGLLLITSSKPLEELAKRVQNAEEVAQNLVALCDGLGPCYFRFSVVAGVDGSALESVDGVIRIVKSLTVGYLEEAEIREHLDAVVDTLTQPHGIVSLERLGSLAAEDGKAKLNAQVEVVHNHIVRMANTRENDIHRKIKKWLTPIDQTAKLDACIRGRSSSTCGWFWGHPKVPEWVEMGGMFWCHAGMGAGKTILASYAIETLMKFPHELFIAYYYFEFTNPATLSEEALFRSIVSQVSHTGNTISQRMYDQHQNGALQPQLRTLQKFLHDLITGTPLPVYIIVDALDEVPNPGRRYILQSLHELASLASDGVHVMVTSRDDVDIHESLSGKVLLDFPVGREMVHHDIINFVDQQFAAKKWQAWPEAEILNMRQILINKADGMFRMVACQIEVLNQAQTTEDIRKALASLPTTLSDTYFYILDMIPAHLRSRAHTLLSILSVALGPVPIEELSELLAVELGDRTDPENLPVYREILQYHEPHNIIGLGTAFIRHTLSYDNFQVVQLSHASVKEYLVQDTRSWCALNDQLAHETTARACLALLIRRESLKHTSSKVGDIHYTIYHWWKHIHLNHSVQLLSQQQKLFETFPWTRSSSDRPLGSSNTYLGAVKVHKSPLIFAAATSLEQMLFMMLKQPFQWKIDDLNNAMRAAAEMGSSPEVIIALIEKGGNVNSTDKYGKPILHTGIYSRQLHVIRVLVEYGADVNSGGSLDNSALEIAASSGTLDIVEFLIEKGADVNRTGGRCGSALQATVGLGGLEVTKLLVEKGADVNLIGGYYGFALQAAARWGTLDVVEFLVEKGADVNLVGGRYASALQAAVKQGVLDIVKFLVGKGADVNTIGGKYGSALQAAARRKAPDVVKFLVKSGADVTVVEGTYGSALDAVETSGWRRSPQGREIISFLIAKGAVRSGAKSISQSAAVEEYPSTESNSN